MTTPFDSYRLLDKTPFAEGGFGRLYRAEHKALGRQACLKQNKDAGAENVELLRNECRLLWDLDGYHSIPTVRDFTEIDKNTAVAVTSYIEGKTLAELVESKGPLHPEDASWIMERLLSALQYIHYYGVIHSDIKPENIIIEAPKHDIKLIDFGLALVKPTHSSRPIGKTMYYAAPELIDGKPPIPETDLYGAGITLLYALGGDVRGKNIPSATPDAIAQFCERLLVYDPTKRPHWGTHDLVREFSDARESAFGRRHRG